MFIICIGVGLFGGINTFAFMAAEVSLLKPLILPGQPSRTYIGRREDCGYLHIIMSMELVSRSRAIDIDNEV